MAEAIQKLLSICQPAVCEDGKQWNAEMESLLNGVGKIGQELKELLRVRNGFTAFDGALLIRSLTNSSTPLGIVQWNDVKLWKCEFKVAIGNVMFFAEDGFGGQFGIGIDGV